MKKSFFITILFSSALLIADDLIVDKNGMESGSYQAIKKLVLLK
ncbi:MAG: hypothetical protein U9N31_08265 [Candidatus Marinimicrobia bacterium]|nr:hypothetical protein [Candidatus Neomarinimicrobiota bacterium]